MAVKKLKVSHFRISESETILKQLHQLHKKRAAFYKTTPV